MYNLGVFDALLTTWILESPRSVFSITVVVCFKELTAFVGCLSLGTRLLASFTESVIGEHTKAFAQDGGRVPNGFSYPDVFL